MGYRPEFRDVQNPDLYFYGTKLYGYVDESKLLSYKYLLSIGKVKEDDLWDYPFEHEMILTAEQFRKFVISRLRHYPKAESDGKRQAH